jgi:hypothetical protein
LEAEHLIVKFEQKQDVTNNLKDENSNLENKIKEEASEKADNFETLGKELEELRHVNRGFN